MEAEYHDDDEDAARPLIHRAAARGDTRTAERLLDEDADPTRYEAMRKLK